MLLTTRNPFTNFLGHKHTTLIYCVFFLVCAKASSDYIMGPKVRDLHGDYLQAAQECVVPILKDDTPDLIKKRTKESKAEVSLNDCLACNGCVTSSEAILASSQSVEFFLSNINVADQINVLSFAPRTLAIIALHYNLSPSTCLQKLSTLFRRYYNIHIVTTTVLAEALTLVEQFREFCFRRNEGPLPLITSHCSAWLCTMEKTLPPWVAQRLSSQLKTPQLIHGTLIKSLTVDALNQRRLRASSLFTPMLYCRPFYNKFAQKMVLRQNLFHVTVMPCFDAKLDSHRPDSIVKVPSRCSMSSEHPVRDVDCVLTTSEVFDLIQRAGGDLPEELSFVDTLWLGTESWPFWQDLCPTEAGLPEEITKYLGTTTTKSISPEEQANIRFTKYNNWGNSSLEYCFRRCSECFYETPIPPNLPLQFRTLGNRDFRITQIGDNCRFIYAYGARNLKNIEAKLGSCDFVEIMACPRGCLYGGGQLCGTENCQCRTQDVQEQDWVSYVKPETLPELTILYRYLAGGGPSTVVGSDNNTFLLAPLLGKYNGLKKTTDQGFISLNDLMW